MKRNIGIFIFDGVEEMDLVGPYQVFSSASEVRNFEVFEVFTVAKTPKPVKAVNGLSVNPHYDFASCPKVDLLIVPGGSGTKIAMFDEEILNWVKDQHLRSELTISICSGSRILGALGLLKNAPYCTHHEVYEDMKKIVPNGQPCPNLRFVQYGKIYTSAGISAGIDLSFHIVEKLHGTELARATAEYMEYDIKIK